LPNFFPECLSFPSVALGEERLFRVPTFLECQIQCGTRESPSSPSVFLHRVFSVVALEEKWLLRVPDFWHSGNFVPPVVIVASYLNAPLFCCVFRPLRKKASSSKLNKDSPGVSMTIVVIYSVTKKPTTQKGECNS
jgi:hypothetical protein